MTIASDIIKITGKNREAVRRCIAIAANDRATIEEKIGGMGVLRAKTNRMALVV